MKQDNADFDSYFDNVFKVMVESSTWREQILCATCCFFFITHVTTAFSTWFIYFMLSNLCTLFRNKWDLYPHGWDETCTLLKIWIIMRSFIQQKFGYSLDDFVQCLYNFVHNIIQDDVVQVDDCLEKLKPDLTRTEELHEESCEKDRLVEQLENCRMEIEDLKMNAVQLRLDRDSKTEIIRQLGILQTVSENLDTKLMARSDTLFEQLKKRTAEYGRLQDTLISTLESKKDLEKQMDQLKARLKFEKEISQGLIDLLISTLDSKEELEKQVDQLKAGLALEKEISEEATQARHIEVDLLNASFESEKEKSKWFNEQLSAVKSECCQLQNMLNSTLERKQDLEKLVDQLEASLWSEKIKVKETSNIAEHYRTLSLEFHNKLTLEAFKTKESIVELETENYELAAQLSSANADLEHFRTLSSEYKEVISMLEEEKKQLFSRLQIAQESDEFHQQILDEYHFI